MKIEARHKILSYINCQRTSLTIEEFESAVKLTGAKVLQSMEHDFKPQGKSILTLLAESHASFHSYPEYNFCYLDIFTCGKMEISKFDLALRQILKPKKIRKKQFNRSFNG